MGRGTEGMSTKRKAKPAKKSDAPCESCRGFTIPARQVKAVARAKNGRFKRQPKQPGLF